MEDEGADLKKILSYYRERVEAHENDRFLFEAKLEKLRVKNAQAHQVEWELKKRTEEKQDLEHALQTCEAALGGERGNIEEM